MEPLLVVLAAAGLLIGATGTWSPCGFSMIETIGPTGHTGGMRTTLAAAATFAPFAVIGGVLTYGALALAGQALLGAGGTIAYVIAAIVALAAALAEARGTPIVPRIRRQLPVGWRSSAPMPLAAAGYGVLLGLGFTTFVLTYGVWALMGVSLALGDPTAGLVVGVAFGLGRALPIVALAPIAGRPSGERVCEAMAMRPGLLRGARVGDAVALLTVAGVLLGGAGAAGAAKTVATGASDPSVAGPVLAFEVAPGRAVLQEGSRRTRVAGTDPAVGGPWLATVRDEGVTLVRRSTDEDAGTVPASGVDAIAVTRSWVAFRTRTGKRDAILAAQISPEGNPGSTFRVAGARSPTQLSRPAVDGSTIVWALAKRGSNALLRARLSAGRVTSKRKLLNSRSMSFAGPSIAGRKIAYVASDRKRQTVRIKGLRGGLGKTVLKRRDSPPTLWTTALSRKRVYVTQVAKGGRGKLISTDR